MFYAKIIKVASQMEFSSCKSISSTVSPTEKPLPRGRRWNGQRYRNILSRRQSVIKRCTGDPGHIAQTIGTNNGRSKNMNFQCENYIVDSHSWERHIDVHSSVLVNSSFDMLEYIDF